MLGTVSPEAIVGLRAVGRATDALSTSSRVHGGRVTISVRPRQIRTALVGMCTLHVWQSTCIREDPTKRSAAQAHHFSLRCSPRYGTHPTWYRCRRQSRLLTIARAPAPDRRPRQDRHGQVHLAAIDRGAGHRPRRWRVVDRSARHAGRRVSGTGAAGSGATRCASSISPTASIRSPSICLPTCIRMTASCWPKASSRRCSRSGATAGVRSSSASCATH